MGFPDIRKLVWSKYSVISLGNQISRSDALGNRLFRCDSALLTPRILVEATVDFETLKAPICQPSDSRRY